MFLCLIERFKEGVGWRGEAGGTLAIDGVFFYTSVVVPRYDPST